MSQRTSIAIHAILALLLATPLYYYWSGGDRRDERFAWRMFSPIRSEKCGAQFLLGVDKTPIKASNTFHSAWVGLASRGRQQVITAMGDFLCEDHPGVELRIRLQCQTRPGSTQGKKGALYDRRREETDEDVEVIARGLFNYCETGTL